jgi:hypothetical protein
MIELGQAVFHAGTGQSGVVIGLGTFLIGGQRALVQPSCGPDGRNLASEWIDPEQLTILGRAVLEPYYEIPPRGSPTHSVRSAGDTTIGGSFS